VGEPKPAYKTVREFIRGPRGVPEPRRDCDLAKTQNRDAVMHVDYGYCLVLGRTADTDSVQHWQASLANGDASVTDMLLTLVRSDEFVSRHATFGLSDRAYVSFLYRMLLNRDADQHGLDSYAKELRNGSMSRESVAQGIMMSSEFQSKHPYLYQAAFDPEQSPRG
jgi:hypothetical protein